MMMSQPCLIPMWDGRAAFFYPVIGRGLALYRRLKGYVARSLYPAFCNAGEGIVGEF